MKSPTWRVLTCGMKRRCWKFVPSQRFSGTLLRNIRRFRLFRPVEHPLQGVCLPTVCLIRLPQSAFPLGNIGSENQTPSVTPAIQQRTVHRTYPTHSAHTHTHTTRITHTFNVISTQCSECGSNFESLEEAKRLVI